MNYSTKISIERYQPRSMTLHVLGLGSIGILNAHLVRSAYSLLQIYYLPRRTSSPSNIYTIYHANGGSTQLNNLMNDINGSKPIEVLLITTKAYHTRNALKSYSDRITKDTLMIFLQNGMGIVDANRDILPSKRIILGTTTHAVFRTTPNQIHWVYSGETLFSPEQSTLISPQENYILSALGKLVPYSTLESRLYQKLALNACINPVTAIFNVLNSHVADSASPAHDLAMRLVKEIQQLYMRLKIDVDVSQLKEDVLELARNTGGNVSSMLADVRGARETEIEFINGYIVKMGRDAGIDVHENEMVVRKVKELRD